jgi:hypothetical protein
MIRKTLIATAAIIAFAGTMPTIASAQDEGGGGSPFIELGVSLLGAAIEAAAENKSAKDDDDDDDDASKCYRQETVDTRQGRRKVWIKVC